MSSISSSAYYSVSNSGSTSNGISGLMSGMDTDQMVEELLAGSQAKIDAATGQQTQIEWKQEMYYEVIASINSFREKYFDLAFDASSDMNFGNSDFFNTMTSTITNGDALKIISSSSEAATGEFDVIVKQLAEKAKIKDEAFSKLSGDGKITSSSLTSEFLNETYSKNIKLTVSGTEVTVNLDDVKSEQDMVDTFNDAFAAKGITNVWTSIDEYGSLTFEGTSGAPDISVDEANSGKLGIEMAGLTSTSTSGNALKGVSSNLNAGPMFDLELNGTTQTIRLDNVKDSDGDGNYTIDDVQAALEKKVQSAFGDYINVGIDGDKLTFSIANVGEEGHDISIFGSEASAIGVEPGSSTKFDLNQTLSEVATGGNFSFNINGEDFEFSGDTTIASMINTINNSSAGITIKYSSISDKMSIEADNSGAGYGIDMTQTEGDVLTKLFGSGVVASASEYASDTLTVNNFSGNALADNYETTAASLTMKVDGKSYTFTLDEKSDESSYTKAEVEQEFNDWIEETFKNEDGTAKITFNASTGTLTATNGELIEFSKSSKNVSDVSSREEAAKTDLAVAFGFNLETNPAGTVVSAERSNKATSDSNISDVVQLQGIENLFTDASGNAAVKLQDIAFANSGAGNIAAKVENGKIVLSGTSGSSVSASSSLASIFGGDELTFGTGSIDSSVVKSGSDAIVNVNGVDTSRSSNVFTIDGLTMQLTKVSELNGTEYEKTTISTERNDEQIVEAFKSFVEDYNKMIELLNGYVIEDPEYKDYAPLTDAQKKEMSENEIELWEEKAKEGLLRNDSNIQSFLSQMRTAIYTMPETSSLALYQIGIETTSDYKDGGKIQLDETMLREALSKDPEGVSNLFTGAGESLSDMFVDIMDNTAKISTGDPGSLVQVAGISGSTYESDMTRELEDLKERITTLTERYEMEKERYWADFNAMEQILANYNAQSTMISQQFSGY